MWAYFHQATMGKSNQSRENTKNALVFKKVTQLVVRALAAVRKQKKLVKVKPQHWPILMIWKEDQGGKNWYYYYTQSFATENLKSQN